MRRGLEEIVLDRDCKETYDVTQASRQVQPGKGDDEWRKVESLDQVTHEKTQRRSHEEHDRYHEQGAHMSLFQEARGDHPREGEHGTNRQVDASGNDDKSHAHGKDQQVRVVDEKVEKVLKRKEPGECDGAQSEHDDEQSEGYKDGKVPGAGKESPSHVDNPFLTNTRTILVLNLSDCIRQTAHTTNAFTTGETSAGTPIA